MNLQHIFLFFNKQQDILDNNEIQLNKRRTNKHIGYNFKLFCVFHDVINYAICHTHLCFMFFMLCGVRVSCFTVVLHFTIK